MATAETPSRTALLTMFRTSCGQPGDGTVDKHGCTGTCVKLWTSPGVIHSQGGVIPRSVHSRFAHAHPTARPYPHHPHPRLLRLNPSSRNGFSPVTVVSGPGRRGNSQ